MSILQMAIMFCQQYIKRQWKSSHFKHDTIDISVNTNNQEMLPTSFVYKNYNTYDAPVWRMNVSYM